MKGIRYSSSLSHLRLLSLGDLSSLASWIAVRSGKSRIVDWLPKMARIDDELVPQGWPLLIESEFSFSTRSGHCLFVFCLSVQIKCLGLPASLIVGCLSFLPMFNMSNKHVGYVKTTA